MRHLPTVSWVQHLYKVRPRPLLDVRWWWNRDALLPLPPLAVVIWLETGPLGASGPAWAARCSGSMEFCSLPPLFDFVLPALRWGSHREGRRTERDSSSHLCQAVRLSSSGSLLCLHHFPWCLKLHLSGAGRYSWGGSACDVLIGRFAITWGRLADLLSCSRQGERE